VGDFRYHSLRHAGASIMDNNNVPLGSIQRILGHENYLNITTKIQLQKYYPYVNDEYNMIRKIDLAIPYYL